MKIAIGSDHRGFDVKRRLVQYLQNQGHEVLDLGTDQPDPCDYPDIAFAVADAVSQQQCDRGILICNTGIGMSIAANKVSGVLAALCHDPITAEMSRRHNDANILCLSAHLLGEEALVQMVNLFLTTDFEGGRHARRVERIREHERKNWC